MRSKYSIFKPQEMDRNFVLSVALASVKMMFFMVLLIGFCMMGLVGGVGKAWIDTAPALDLDILHSQSQTSFIYDKNNNLITEYKGSENRIYVNYDEVPKNLVNAVIAIEDARFWSHSGVDVKRIGGAFISTFFRGDTQGGSTITCQLVKLTLLTSDQNFKRKVQEAYLALQLEEQISKEEILEEYLNVIYLGGSSYGVKIAALDYFGKDLSQLTLRECATLAAVIRNPYRYNPRRNYYTLDNPKSLVDRTDYVLEQMHNQELITDEEYQQALGEQLHVLEESMGASDAMYDNAYYVEYAIYDVVTKMLRVENLEDNSTNRAAMQRKLRTGGYSVYTSLDPEVQKVAQEVITEWSNYPGMRYQNDRTSRSSLGGGEYITLVQPQAAAAVMDWRTGELVAIVGGRQEPVQKMQLNRAYQMDMPVGSSIKPLSVYGPAFDLGYSPGTPVLNLPIPIVNWHSERGYPQNYGGGDKTFTGVESMRYALNKSHNTAAAQALMTYVGIENSVTYLLRLGVDADHILANGSGLSLGSSGISVIEMANAFGAIANLGEYRESYAFTKVLNPDGSTYIDINQVQVTRQVFKQSTAWMLVDVLKGCVGSGGTGSRANFGLTIAGKTGTNSNNIGVTFAGMSAYYSAAVWVGSDNYKPLISSATGGTYAAPLWSQLMKAVHIQTGNTEDRDIITKSAASVGLVRATACSVSGMAPTSACQHDINGYDTTTDYYLSGTEPTTPCNMHRAVRMCRRSRRRATSSCSSTSVYGVIYIPAGHPLRMAESMSDVRKYFAGASTDEDSTSIPRCNSCG